MEDPYTMFFHNFSSAGKGGFMSSKAKRMHQRCTFLEGGEGGSGVRDMAAPLLGNVGAEFSETLFPHFKTYFLQIDCCYL